MRNILMLVAMVGCGGMDAPAPSCQQAVDHYYASGCGFSNAQGPISESDEVLACQNSSSTEPANCTGELDAWLTCLDNVPANSKTNADCDCSVTFMALIGCH